jgi:arylsulfatase A-like enzyme/Flp pilus assembly protein TadD
MHTVRRLAYASVAAHLLLLGMSCKRATPPVVIAPSRTSILLVTLDTTRADAIGPDAAGVQTPAFTAVAGRGRRFRQAYATIPETLPSHASILTGLYPAGHGVHENGRSLAAGHVLIAERLKQAGYRTAAFVSSFVLARRFGLARGFDTYDDELPAKGSERASAQTTERALAYLDSPSDRPQFVWVHYFDPHTPYVPAEPFRTRYAKAPYQGEIAAMDQELGRLVEGFERRVKGQLAIVIAGDHGEGLGDHGESQHGHLVYQSTMHVPLVIVGPGVASGVSETPVSIRRIFHTLMDLAGLEQRDSLLGPAQEVVLGEAMKPFLEYGWLPQTMAVEGTTKAILAGKLEVYDLGADPAEERNLGAGANVPSTLRKALEDYPVPSLDNARPPAALDDDARRRLASLGYISASAPPVVRRNAPRPADMVRLLDVIEQASSLFVSERYTEAIPLLERILSEDPHNLDAALRLATAHSMLGRDDRALAAFRKASRIAPTSSDVRTYLALHYARGSDWQRAVPLLERIVSEDPDRLPVLEALAAVREKQGRMPEALELRQKIYASRAPTAAELLHLGGLAMEVQQTGPAIASFEKARVLQGAAFDHDLELGVLYLAARRLEEARSALDRVPATHSGYPMALFKRAQVSVLLKEPDAASRIEAARRAADATTRDLIRKEKLFVK